jgi:hypothetical protein
VQRFAGAPDQGGWDPVWSGILVALVHGRAPLDLDAVVRASPPGAPRIFGFVSANRHGGDVVVVSYLTTR